MAISCTFAACATIIGPGFAGAAVAHAGLLGIDIDIDIFDLFDDHNNNNKSNMHHPRPGSGVNAQSAARTTAGVAAAEAPKAKIGSQPENLTADESVGTRSLASVPENVAIAQSGTSTSGGGGGGGLPLTTVTGRAGNLPRVSTAPSARRVVIRGAPRTAAPAAVPVLPQAPGAVALAAHPPVTAEPEGLPTTDAPPTPSLSVPEAKSPVGVSDSGLVQTPYAFRSGYPEYLRTASTGELIAEALPGVAGIAGFTIMGAFVGYRQARAVQRALLAPAPTSMLL
ncbi:hypothetical protein A5662_13135 [Mycobacteriaceae bacterium 1482268.1]|nr:hypothetical protein A5662_13135 [Mycobacteriaceae bacterium 1482268.1]